MINIEKLIEENNLEELLNTKFRYTEIWEGLSSAVNHGSKAALEIILTNLDSFESLHDKGFKVLSSATGGDKTELVEILLAKGAHHESTLGESSLSNIKSKEMAEVYKKYISSIEDLKILEESLVFWNKY